MKDKKFLILAALLCSFLSFACVYIVVPEGLEPPKNNRDSKAKTWNAVATGVTKTDAGDLHIDLTIQNDTDDWSTLQAEEGKPAKLTSGGKTTDCDTVFVGTGGHRLAPGFQMRGYTAGTKTKPETQLLYVECKDAESAPGSKLSIDYISFSGILDDYDPEGNKSEGTLVVELDNIVTDLVFPIESQVEGLIRPTNESITGLSENVVTLLDAQRTETGFTFSWQNFNPTKFPLKTHIGTPPVTCADGIIYGRYETLDMVSVPITPAKANMEWATEVVVPKDSKSCYMLLSVESNKPRTYINYALDISDK